MISCKLYLDIIVGGCISCQCTVISDMYNFALSETTLNVALFFAFHLSTHPLDALKSSIPCFLLNHLVSSEGPVYPRRVI